VAPLRKETCNLVIFATLQHVIRVLSSLPSLGGWIEIKKESNARAHTHTHTHTLLWTSSIRCFARFRISLRLGGWVESKKSQTHTHAHTIQYHGVLLEGVLRVVAPLWARFPDHDSLLPAAVDCASVFVVFVLYICTHIRTHTYTHTHKYIHIFMYMKIYTNIYIYICVYMYTYIYTYVYLYTYLYMHMCEYIYMYIHIYICIYTTYIHVYMYVCVRESIYTCI